MSVVQRKMLIVKIGDVVATRLAVSVSPDIIEGQPYYWDHPLSGCTPDRIGGYKLYIHNPPIKLLQVIDSDQPLRFDSWARHWEPDGKNGYRKNGFLHHIFGYTDWWPIIDSEGISGLEGYAHRGEEFLLDGHNITSELGGCIHERRRDERVDEPARR